MKKLKNNFSPDLVGAQLKILGVILFLLCFWIPGGLTLAGEGGFLGPWQSELLVALPVSGWALILVLSGAFLQRDMMRVSLKQVLFLLSFGAVWIALELSSNQAQVSIMASLIWALGLLSVSLGPIFLLRNIPKQGLFLAGMTIGMMLSVQSPDLGISRELLSFAAIIGMIAIMREKYFPYRTLFLLLQMWIVFMSQNIWLVLLAFVLGITAAVWASQLRFERQRSCFRWPGIFLIGLTLWGFQNHHFQPFLTGNFLPHFFDSTRHFLLGVGEGQFLPALAHFSPVHLTPDQFLYPGSGLFSVLYEKGLLGLSALIALLVTPIYFWPQKSRLWVGVFLWMLIFTQDLWITSEGILLLCVFLLAQEEGSGGKYENKL